MDSGMKSPNTDYEILPEELTLLELAEKYQQSLPLRVRVYKGFYGYCDKTSLSEGDIFNIHFVKKSKVVNILDYSGGHYKVALNSAIQFGIIFDPNANKDEGLNGFTFEKVSDILQHKTLPKIVRANAAWKGHGLSNSVEKNEILALRSVRKTLGYKFLKVYSITASKKKELPETCAGNFSTKPYEVRLYMLELVNHIEDPFPCKCTLFVNRSMSNDLPSFLFSSVITLECSVIETSLIATSAYGDEDDGKYIIEIPVDMEVEVQIMKPKMDSINAQLYEDTRTLFEQFNPMHVQQHIANTVPHANANAQSTFYSYVREGNELAGIDLVTPANVYASPEDVSKIPIPERQPLSPVSTTALSPTRTQQLLSKDLDPLHNQELAQHSQSVEKSMQDTKLKEFPNQQADFTKLTRELTSAKADIRCIEGRSMKTTEDIAQIRKELAQISVAVEKLLGWSEGLQSQMDQLKQKIPEKESSTYQATPLAKSGSDVSQCNTELEANRTFLATLDFVQILNLLGMMDMSQHCDSFKSEQVNGELLLECDDEVLKNDLKMSSKLQRLRLMKVILGKQSAEKILKGEDPYNF